MSKNSKTTSTAQMTEAEARELTDAIKNNMNELAKLAQRVIEGKAHKALGYSSVEAWARAELGYGRSRMYQFAAWKRSEGILIETFDLAEDWQSNELAMRSIKFDDLLSAAEVKLDGIEDAEKRGESLVHLINKMYDEAAAQDRAKKLEAKTSGAIDKAGDTEPSGTEAADDNPSSPDLPSAHAALTATATVVPDDALTSPPDEDYEMTPAADSLARYVETVHSTAGMLTGLNDAYGREKLIMIVENARAALDKVLADMKVEVK